VDEEPVGHVWAPVTRVTFDREIPGVGRTVVVKTRRVEGEGYGGPPHLRRELAGLQIAGATNVTPRLIASDASAGVVIAADLGRWPTLESVLLGDDAEAAAAAMIDLGRAVGRLHAATLGTEELHRDVLAAVGESDPRGSRLGHWPGVGGWREVEIAAAALGFPDAGVAADDIAVIVDRLLEPAPFGALIHLDLNPTNVLVTPEGVRLVDFEQSVFGHIGIDASFLHYPFPNYSPHWAIVPAEIVTDADRAYRRELAQELPAGAFAGYDEMLAIGAAAALAVRVQRLAKLADPAQSVHDSWRRRAQLVQQIRVFDRLAATAGCLPTLATWFTELADAMSDRWPDATTPPPPLFPAFCSMR